MTEQGTDPMWIDSHCHVTADDYDSDQDAVLERARAAGVHRMIAIGSGYGVASNAAAVALAEQHPYIWATAGVHPHEASELDDALRVQLRQWLAHPRTVALGECGLDYHYMNSPRATQTSVLSEQLALAREVDLPVVIHVRGDEPDAYEELLEIWQAEGRGELEGVLHCYTGTLDFAQRALDDNFYISFSGIVTFKGSHQLRETARALPLDRLMVETDAPFLAPQGHRGRRNEPAWLHVVGETLAELHGVTPQLAAQITSENVRSLFRLPEL